jgi:hypothetical protein
MKRSTSLLAMFMLASSIPLCQAMESTTPELVKVTFSNLAGGDISVTPVYSDGQKAAPIMIENGASYTQKLKPGASRHKESIYLNDIQTYEIQYCNGLASRTASLLTIAPSEFEQAAGTTDLGSTVVHVTIKPKTYTSPLTGIQYPGGYLGLDKEISVRALVSTKKNKQKEESQETKEQRILLGALNITTLNFEPHTIFELGTPPQVFSDNGKNQTVQLYVAALRAAYKKLTALWDPTSDNGEYDQSWFESTGIKDFSKKVSAIIDTNYKKLLESLHTA